jgi:hypothetical protein
LAKGALQDPNPFYGERFLLDINANKKMQAMHTAESRFM